MKIILTIVYILFTTAGIFLIKIGGNSLTFSLGNGLTFKVGYLTLLGLIAYLVSFILWQKLLTTFDLSYIVPITTGITQIIILLMGMLFFKETINWVGIVGVLLVISGVVMIMLGKK